MAPNRVALSKNAAPNKSLYATVKDEATNPENTTIVRSLLVFGVCELALIFILGFIPLDAKGLLTDEFFLGRCRIPPQQPRRAPPPSVSRASQSSAHLPINRQMS